MAKLFFAALCCIAFTSCSSSSPTDPENMPTAPPTSSDSNITESVGNARYDGVWLGQCYPEPFNTPPSYYDTVALTLNNGSYSTELRFYTDVDCTVPETDAGLPNFDIQSGTFTLGSEVTTADGVVATEFDVFPEQSLGFDAAQIEQLGADQILQLIHLSNDVLYLGTTENFPDDFPAAGARLEYIHFDRAFVLQ